LAGEPIKTDHLVASETQHRNRRQSVPDLNGSKWKRIRLAATLKRKKHGEGYPQDHAGRTDSPAQNVFSLICGGWRPSRALGAKTNHQPTILHKSKKQPDLISIKELACQNLLRAGEISPRMPSRLITTLPYRYGLVPGWAEDRGRQETTWLLIPIY
jgi:hypothetical protein